MKRDDGQERPLRGRVCHLKLEEASSQPGQELVELWSRAGTSHGGLRIRKNLSKNWKLGLEPRKVTEEWDNLRLQDVQGSDCIRTAGRGRR